MSFYRNIALFFYRNIAHQNRLSDEGLRGNYESNLPGIAV